MWSCCLGMNFWVCPSKTKGQISPSATWTIVKLVWTMLQCMSWSLFFGKNICSVLPQLLFPGKSCSGISGHLTVQMSSESSMYIPAATVWVKCFYPLHFGALPFKSDLSRWAFTGIKLQAGRLEGLLKIAALWSLLVDDLRSQPKLLGHPACLKPPQQFPGTLSGDGESKTLHHAETALTASSSDMCSVSS